LQGTVKELAQLDGAFVITEDGTVVAACRYLDAPATESTFRWAWGLDILRRHQPRSTWA
jgi:hypothetical protein